KLYSSFLPIPLSIPCPLPIPSSSSKPVTTITHHIYARPHTSKPSSSSEDAEGDFPSDRTVFVANLPVDMSERRLRGVFGKWGVVERVVMGGQSEGDVLERALRGMDVEDSDDEASAEGEGDGGGWETVGADGEVVPSSDPKFLGDPTLPSRKRRRLNKLPKSVPEVTALPPLNPRSDTYGPSGLRTAHIIYLEPICVSRVMSYSGSSIPFSPSSESTANPSGLPYYLARHSALRPALSAVKAFSDSSMARFDHLHSLLLSSRAKQAGAGALLDEDGFTVVVRSGNHSRTGGIADRMGRNVGSVGIAGKGFGKAGFAGKAGKKSGGLGTAELQDFYKFQKMDRKKQELVDLRSKFEEDKKKVEEMKRAKRFRPY
ncbi:ribosomal RNA-processing protein 7-domain-containing protein, partial [Dioszegia hungarica]